MCELLEREASVRVGLAALAVPPELLMAVMAPVTEEEDCSVPPTATWAEAEGRVPSDHSTGW